MLSVFTNNIDRLFTSPKPTNPYFFRHDIVTSIGWYWDYLGDLISFSLLMYCVVLVLKPVYIHFRDTPVQAHTGLFIFTKLWHRIFLVIFVTSILDIIHYVLAARQIQQFFLIQNAVYLIMTGYFIFKAYHKNE